MATATQSPAVTSPLEMLRSVSPAERLKLLRELVKLCFADGNLNKPLRVADEKNTHVGLIMAMYPRTTEPLPPLTDEERADLQRRLDNPEKTMSHDEFVARARTTIRELRESRQS
jgi:hypothetical protein